MTFLDYFKQRRENNKLKETIASLNAENAKLELKNYRQKDRIRQLENKVRKLKMDLQRVMT